MVVTLSTRGYIKRTQLTTYQAQNRGGKGITGGKNSEEDAMEHLFVTSTHAWLLFFTNFGKVYWQKVYDLPLQGRTAKGRALINLLNLANGEEVENCIGVKDFDDEHFLLMATKNGIVKKTALSEYSRPKQGGIIALRLKEGDELVDVVVVGPGDDVLLATASGMTIRFPHTNARKMGRATAGVRGIKLGKGDELVGIVVANPEMCLLTVCKNGYGKQTPFGLGGTVPDQVDDDAGESEDETPVEAYVSETDGEESEHRTERSGFHYRSQNRGGKGIRDIRTTARNGKVVAILAVSDDDEVLMVTTGGKIQRLRAGDISVVGRNTQGVRIIRLEDDDKLASMARIPSEIVIETTVVDISDKSESTIDATAADSNTSAPNPDSEAESGSEEV
jgi:DNA gyrase subunit A